MSIKCQHLVKQGVALTGRNTTGPPCSRGAIIRLEIIGTSEVEVFFDPVTSSGQLYCSSVYSVTLSYVCVHCNSFSRWR